MSHDDLNDDDDPLKKNAVFACDLQEAWKKVIEDKGVYSEQISYIFEMIDTDGDGYIEEDKLSLSIGKILDFEACEKKKDISTEDQEDFDELQEYRDYIVEEIMGDFDRLDTDQFSSRIKSFKEEAKQLTP